jgi:hypothetical protein
VGGFLANIFFGQQQHQLNQQAQAAQEADVAAGYGLLGQQPSAGQLTGQAQNLAQQGIGMGNQYFNPGQQQQWFNQFLGPTMQGLQGLPGQVAGQTGGLNQLAAQGGAGLQQQFGQGAGNLMGAFGQRTGQVGGQFQDLFRQAQQVSAGLGEQERADINRRYNQFGASQAADLANRGLSASTIATSTQRGVEEQRGQELGRLGERMQGQQLGILGQFGGGAASAMERLTGGQLGAQQAMLGMGTGLGQNLLAQQLGIGQFGAGLGANVGLGALGQMGGLGMGQLGMMGQANANQLQNLYNFGQLPISTGMQGVQQGLGFIGSINRIPGQSQPVQIQPGLN